MPAGRSDSGWSAESTRQARRRFQPFAPTVWQQPRAPSDAAHLRSYVVPIIHLIDDSNHRGIDGCGLAPERVTSSFALDDDQDALANTGADGINRDERHAAGSAVQRQRLNE